MYLTVTNGRRSWMLDLVSTIKPSHSAGASITTCVPRCLTTERQVRRRKMLTNWLFVSPVSLVSANLKIINNAQKRGRERRRGVLLVGLPPAPGQVRLAQRRRIFAVRQQSRDTSETAETRAVACLVVDRVRAAQYHHHVMALAQSSSATSQSARMCLVSRTWSSTAPQQHQILQPAVFGVPMIKWCNRHGARANGNVFTVTCKVTPSAGIGRCTPAGF
jgi:hypothetical protein